MLRLRASKMTTVSQDLKLSSQRDIVTRRYCDETPWWPKGAMLLLSYSRCGASLNLAAPAVSCLKGSEQIVEDGRGYTKAQSSGLVVMQHVILLEIAKQAQTRPVMMSAIM